jgi:IS1 family transposase
MRHLTGMSQHGLIWWKFWIAVLVVAFSAIPQVAFGIDHKKAVFQPMRDIESIRVVDSADQIRNPLIFGEDLRCLSVHDEWNGCNRVRCQHLRDGISSRNIGKSPVHQHVLKPAYVGSVVTHSNGILHTSPKYLYFDIGSSCFADVLGVKPIAESGRWLNRLNLYPCPLVDTERFNALMKLGAGNPILLDHLPPYRQRYEGIDGRCHNRSLRRILYLVLSGVLAICFGLSSSRRLFVEGDEYAYRIPSKFLIPLSFLSNMFGFGMVLESTLYFTNACPEGDEDSANWLYKAHDNIVTQKLLTMLDCCNTLIPVRRTQMANVLNADKQIAIIAALAEGSSIRAIERMTGVHRDTIMRLGVRVGQGCAELLDEKMRNLSCEQLQFDEIWGFIGKKERHCNIDDNPELGDVWTFCAIDRDTKIVPSFRCGKRDLATTNAFVADVASRIRNRVQISSDALKSYVDAIETNFGADVDFAQIVKTYVTDDSHIPERRFSAPEIVITEKKAISGFPDMGMASTSHVERLNGTTRLHMRRLTRLTYAFSKKLDNFKAAAALHFAYYNFVKRHITLRATPAMAAGIERDFWTVGMLLEAI